ncbi:Nucleoporin nup82 [Sugiyamaella lignohabitans]|uniref:Nucleoporin nup82 n=1 Tax=Sugiyamaella lignohabitans TaxID=796027 RepID=A0A161HG49_9ASCO|nr:Nucleoporin nup82 [Sugiyamaella lignohabitans]ANB12992.1 Nucleoporin nup82 [Sugiyamaella lignohabitans]
MASKLSKFTAYVQNHKVFDCAPQQNLSAGPLNLVAVRDNDVITVSGSIVKYAILDTKLQSPNTYDLVTVDFEILDLVLNRSGTLLAVVGKYTLIYLYLPTSGCAPDNLKKKGTTGGNSYPGSVNNFKIELTSGKITGSESSDNVSTSTSTSTAKRQCEILKVVWNSIASHDSNLVLLLDNGYIRSYDIVTSHKFPDYELCLLGNGSIDNISEDRSYALDNEDSIQDPVSIAFGSDADPLGKLTLYVLTKEGDIFGLCPWVPAKFILSKQEVSELFDNAVADQYQYKQEHGKESLLNSHYRDQLAWTTDLWRQIDTSPQEVRLSKRGTLESCHVLNRPNIIISRNGSPQKLQPQGPFRYQPFPDTLYEGSAIDFISTDSGSMTTLAVLYSTGRINFYLQDISLDMIWEGANSLSDICLALIESITIPNDPVSKGQSTGTGVASASASPFSLGSVSGIPSHFSTPKTSNAFSLTKVTTPTPTKPGSFRLIKTSTTNELEFYVISGPCVYRVDFSPWAIPLSQAIEGSNSQEALSVVSSHLSSNIWVILDKSRNQSPVLGIGALPDPLGMHIPFVHTQKLVYIEVPDSNESTSRSISSSLDLAVNSTSLASSSQLTSIPARTIKYTSLLKTPFSHSSIDAKLSEISFEPPLAPKGVSITDVIKPNTENLAYLSEISNYYCEQLSKLHESGLHMHTRLDLQRSELHRQIKKVSELYNTVQKLEQQRPTKTLAEIFDKQERLRQRSLSLLEKLSRRRSILLSNQEKKWLAELQRSQERIYDPAGLERRVKNVSNSLQHTPRCLTN